MSRSWIRKGTVALKDSLLFPLDVRASQSLEEDRKQANAVLISTNRDSYATKDSLHSPCDRNCDLPRYLQQAALGILAGALSKGKLHGRIEGKGIAVWML